MGFGLDSLLAQRGQEPRLQDVKRHSINFAVCPVGNATLPTHPENDKLMCTAEKLGPALLTEF